MVFIILVQFKLCTPSVYLISQELGHKEQEVNVTIRNMPKWTKWGSSEIQWRKMSTSFQEEDPFSRRWPNSLEPFLYLVQGLHGDGRYHYYFALVVFEHQHQIKILQVELQASVQLLLHEVTFWPSPQINTTLASSTKKWAYLNSFKVNQLHFIQCDDKCRLRESNDGSERKHRNKWLLQSCSPTLKDGQDSK